MAEAPERIAAGRIRSPRRLLSFASGPPTRNASSASATWRDRASASEYTATVAMPMRRAVLVTRQAISPRLAIRILAKTGRTLFLLLGALFHRLPQPCGLALLEKGAHAFLALRGGPGGGDASGHVVHQSGIDPPPRDRTDQVLGHRVRPGRTLDELAQARVDRRVQLRGLRQLLNEADAVRLRRRKTLGGEEIAPRGALAHRGEDIGTDGGRRKAQAHFGHAELGVGRRDRDVASGNER